MVELVRGRYGDVESGLWRGRGLMYCSREGGRTPSRRVARMAERAMKRPTAARKSLVRREVATVEVNDASSLVQHESGAVGCGLWAVCYDIQVTAPEAWSAVSSGFSASLLGNKR